MKYLRWLLFPFSLLYGTVIALRNWCYDAGLFKSRQYNLPVICVGNLDVGGAGKSPMTEYLIRLLKPHSQVAVLSRGYGRKTQGYHLAEAGATAAQVGDEPAQFKQKFPDVAVAVCEKRVTGIENLLPDHEVILLDDAYQHRAVRAGLNILLFDYSRLQKPHLLLPAGNLREPYSGRRRADVLVVTKCPAHLSDERQAAITKLLKPYKHQQVYFSAIRYQPMQNMCGQPVNVSLDSTTAVFLLTGIANPAPLLQYINQHTLNVIHYDYPDHHQFSLKNIAKLAVGFKQFAALRKVIITTEKDAQRLRHPHITDAVRQLPVWVLPIGTEFLNNGAEPFNELVNTYVRKHTTHHRLHQNAHR